MQTKKQNGFEAPKKKRYQTPQVTVLGHAKKLTLKSGSNTDGFGGSFV